MNEFCSGSILEDAHLGGWWKHLFLQSKFKTVKILGFRVRTLYTINTFSVKKRVHRVTELCSVFSVMPEEVTYATLKFSSPKTKEPRESHSLKRMGRSTPSKVWCPIAFISLLLNLVVLAGLGTLGLTNYYKLIIFGSRTHYDAQENVTERVERTTTLPTNMPTNVSATIFLLSSDCSRSKSCFISVSYLYRLSSFVFQTRDFTYAQSCGYGMEVAAVTFLLN
ncbi:hypothetical protein J1605_021040 [Eschrichtius robustus]|uniref:Uncharacterized protein n=1 Tax=Eschrichtius robustus TaxID=9764 RepID=A0AB34HDQ0_ESCRO|nr:hypothetical protein J1605_021040 [Eschrichtius robustus]